MRARLRSRWPALARIYGIRPFEVKLLSSTELADLVADLDELARHQARQARGTGR